MQPKYFGPFVVMGRTAGGTYMLKDTTDDMYHKNVPPSHLKLVSGDPYDSQQEFEVEAIVNHRGYPNNYEYKVKWKDYPSSQNTWEPSYNLAGSGRLIQEYWIKKKKDKGF